MIGVSSVDITPEQPIWLAGWGMRKMGAQGVTQKIFLKAIAFDDGKCGRGIWVTSDLLGWSSTITKEIHERLRTSLGLEPSEIILNASHNHSAPVTSTVLPLYYALDATETATITHYTRRVINLTILAAELAWANREPATLHYGIGLAGFAVDRRRARPGCRNTRPSVDHDVPTLAVRNPRGQLRAVVFGYACHPTTIENGKIHGDFPGYACARLEEIYPGAAALFMAGCGGDANPLPRFQSGLDEKYGFILASAVTETLDDSSMGIVEPSLSMAFSLANLPFSAIPSGHELINELPNASPQKAREIHHLLGQLKQNGFLPSSCQYPIHVWKMGKQLLHIALAGEPVAELSLRMKAKYGWHSTWVSGYNDDLTAYIPSARISREGGYEGGEAMREYGWPSPFAESVESLIYEQIEALHPL